MGRRYRRDDSDLEDFLRSLIVFVVFGSLGLFLADRALFYQVAAGSCILIILVTVALIRWFGHRDRKRNKQYLAINEQFGSVLNNFVDQFGRAEAKEAAFKRQQYAFTREHLTYMQDDLAKRGFALSTKDLSYSAPLH